MGSSGGRGRTEIYYDVIRQLISLKMLSKRYSARATRPELVDRSHGRGHSQEAFRPPQSRHVGTEDGSERSGDLSAEGGSCIAGLQRALIIEIFQ
jgi:hypothetical protein